jgi:ATP-dependent exoDNAse (exonuclease V) beta subunit
VQLDEFAIIVRTNKEVEDWTGFLKANSFNVRSKLNSNILDSRFVRLFLDILNVVRDPFSNELKVADLLRSSIWEINKVDVLKTLRKLSSANYIKKDKIKIFDFLCGNDFIPMMVPKTEPESPQQNLFSDNEDKEVFSVE